MKKLIYLFVALAAFYSCKSDNGESQRFDSELVVDGVEFRPNRGTYGYSEPDLPGSSEMWFSMSRVSGSNVQQSLNINIMFPTGSSGPEGEFDFGPGTAEDFLVNAGYSNGENGYAIVGYTMTVTRLAEDEFLFEFNNPVALDLTAGFAEKPMSGSVRAKLTFVD